jgi:hypothetical protein
VPVPSQSSELLSICMSEVSLGKNSVPLSCCKNSHIYENQPSSYQFCKIYQDVNVNENDRPINPYLYQTVSTNLV